jgi:hypothetical protein
VRIGKSVLAMLAGLSLILGGCAGAATSSPGSSSTAGGKTASAAVATPSPTPVDGDALFAKGIAGGPTWKSFHVKIALGGTVKASFIKSSDPATTIKNDLTLDGAVIEGDIDAVNLALHLPMTIPAMPGLSSDPLVVDVIIKDSVLYLKSPASGTKYHSTKLGTAAKELGITQPVPTPGGSALVGMADMVETLRQHLEGNGVTPTVAGIESIGGKDAYRIDLSVPLDKLNGDIAAAEASANADITQKMTIDSASASIWIYKDTYQLAQVQLAGASSSVGNLTFTMTLTNFDQPVTIDAPAAKDVQAGN